MFRYLNLRAVFLSLLLSFIGASLYLGSVSNPDGLLTKVLAHSDHSTPAPPTITSVTTRCVGTQAVNTILWSVSADHNSNLTDYAMFRNGQEFKTFGETSFDDPSADVPPSQVQSNTTYTYFLKTITRSHDTFPSDFFSGPSNSMSVTTPNCSPGPTPPPAGGPTPIPTIIPTSTPTPTSRPTPTPRPTNSPTPIPTQTPTTPPTPAPANVPQVQSQSQSQSQSQIQNNNQSVNISNSNTITSNTGTPAILAAATQAPTTNQSTQTTQKGEVPSATAPKVTSEANIQAKELPKTGLPEAVLGLASLLPLGLKLRKFGSIKEFTQTANSIWEEKQFKA